MLGAAVKATPAQEVEAMAEEAAEAEEATEAMGVKAT